MRLAPFIYIRRANTFRRGRSRGIRARCTPSLSGSRPTPTTVRRKCDTQPRRSGGGRSPGLGAHGAPRFCLDPGLRRDDNVVKSRHIQSARFFAIRADRCVLGFPRTVVGLRRDDQRLSGTRFKAPAHPRPGRRAVHQEDSFLLRAALSPGPRPTPGRPGIESSRLENIFTPPSPSSSSVPSTPSFSELSARDSFLYPLAQRMLAPARPLCAEFLQPAILRPGEPRSI